MRISAKLLIVFCIFMTACISDSLDKSIADTSARLRESPSDCEARSNLAKLYWQKGWIKEGNQQMESYQACKNLK